MDATPFEHDVELAEAAKCTGDCTVTPLLGAVTFTPAHAPGANVVKMHANSRTAFCI
jgi:hypothetical protein